MALRCMTEMAVHRPPGRVRTMPPHVVPKPSSDPIPRSGRRAPPRDDPPGGPARHRGAGLRVLDPGGAALGRGLLRDPRARGVPIGDAVNANLATVTTFFCHHDEDEAIRAGPRGCIRRLLPRPLLRFRPPRSQQTDLWADYQRRRAETGVRPHRGAAAGADASRLGARRRRGGERPARGHRHPAQVRDYLRRDEAFGVDQVILASTAGKNRHEDIMESLELFAAPDPARIQGPRRPGVGGEDGRLAPVIEKVMAENPGPTIRPSLPVMRSRRSPGRRPTAVSRRSSTPGSTTTPNGWPRARMSAGAWRRFGVWRCNGWIP